MYGADQEKPADLLVLSPHFDDAALSCGGLIARTTARGGRVIVATVMAAVPRHLLNRHVQAAKACAYVSTRSQEDEAAMRILGASRALGPFADCIYRLSTTGTRFAYEPDTVLGGSYAGEPGLVDDVAAWLTRFRATRVLAPAAVGGHVDHVLVRDAALAAFPSVDLYEDYPYAATRTAEIPQEGWRVEALCERLDTDDLAAKVRAISAYASQLPMLFAGADIASLLESFAARDGDRVERYWRATASTSGG